MPAATGHSVAFMKLGERVRAERQARGWTLKDLSDRSGVEIGTISALEARKSTKSDFAAPLAAAFGVPLEHLLGGQVEQPPIPTNRPGLRVVVHEVSNPAYMVNPKRLTWEEVVAGAELDQLFQMAIPDDAMAPDYPRGLEMIWSTSKRPQAGSLVLVRVGGSTMHVREFHQGRAPGQWVAASSSRAYASFDSAEHQVEVVAVAAFKGMP